ncbi:MAG TPA: alpha/beta hydrolase [Fusibacter sp.]|nr:alpha/beta hydrolase [Fusibacter sp.]
MSLRSNAIRLLMKRTLDFNKPLDEVRKDLEKIKIKRRIKQTINVENVVIEKVPCTLIVPEGGSTDKIILYLHGGGYCLGITDAVLQHAIDFAEFTETTILLLDYGLSPEEPYPVAIEQVKSVYSHCAKDRKICLLGESSGCGLALNLMVSLREQGVSQPRGAMLLTPFLDASFESESNKTMAARDPFHVEDAFVIAKYYTRGLNPKDPWVSPLFHKVHDLAPILLHVAEYDTLADDGRSLYKKLWQVGSVVEYREWRQMWHVFHMQYPLVPEAKTAFYLCREFILRNMQ